MKSFLLRFLFLLVSMPAFAQSEVDERLAMDYYQTGAFDQALPLYQKLFASGSHPDYYDPYLSVLLKTKNYQLAEELIAKMIKSDKNSSIYQIDYGRLLQEQGFKEKAEEIYNSLLRNIPKSEFAIRELAGSFYRANALDYSIKAFLYGRKALNDPQAFGFDLISLYRYQKSKQLRCLAYVRNLYESKLKDSEKAKFYYEKIIMDFPGSLYISEARLRFRKLRGDSLG